MFVVSLALAGLSAVFVGTFPVFSKVPSVKNAEVGGRPRTRRRMPRLLHLLRLYIVPRFLHTSSTCGCVLEWQWRRWQLR
jgi:hypothetical protein